MGGVAGHDHAQAVLPGLVDGHLHAALADDHAHAVVTVDHGGGLAVPHDLELGHRVLDATFDDAVVVDGLETADAVRVDAALVGVMSTSAQIAGVVFGHADALEDVHHERFQKIERHPGVVRRWTLLCHFSLLSSLRSVHPVDRRRGPRTMMPQ